MTHFYEVMIIACNYESAGLQSRTVKGSFITLTIRTGGVLSVNRKLISDAIHY